MLPIWLYFAYLHGRAFEAALVERILDLDAFSELQILGCSTHDWGWLLDDFGWFFLVFRTQTGHQN